MRLPGSVSEEPPLRPGWGPYEVDANPYAANPSGIDPERYNQPGPGQPRLWCQWQVCWDGCCLAWDGREKLYAPIPWLRYLDEHFLRPGAVASTTGGRPFDDSTFDHRLDAMVVGCRRDNKELFAITAASGVIGERTLRPADPRYLDFPPLAYEDVIESQSSSVPRGERRRRRGRLGVVDPQPP